MAKTIKFRHFGPTDPNTDKQPELPSLDAKQLADRAKKSIASLRCFTAAGNRSSIAEARKKFNPAAAWVEWAFAEREGYKPPSGAVVQFREEGDQTIGQFHTKRHVWGTWTKEGFPRSYRGNGRWISDHDAFDPIGPAIVVPAHCVLMNRPDLWHVAHQAGGSPAELAAIGGQSYRDCDGVVAFGDLAEPATADDVAGQPAAFLAAVRARVAARRAERAADEAASRKRKTAEFPAREAEQLAADAENTGEHAEEWVRQYWQGTPCMKSQRGKWWELAQDARDLGLAEARDRCAAKAIGYHRTFVAYRSTEQAEAIAHLANLRDTVKLRKNTKGTRCAEHAEAEMTAAAAAGLYEDEILWRGRLIYVMTNHKLEEWAEAFLAGDEERKPYWAQSRTRMGGYRRRAA